MTKKAVLLIAVLLGATLTLSPVLGNSEGGEPVSLPDGTGSWTVFSDMRVDPTPTQPGSVEVRGVGSFTYDPTAVTTLRPDLFAGGRFSPFDVLVQLAARGELELEYAYDESQATFVVRSINGLDGWWYDVRLPGGALERTALRMDSYPIKDGAAIYFYLEDPERLAAIQASFREEASRLATNAGQVVVPVVTIKGPRATATFHDVLVKPHNVRPDVFQPGAITALDVLLSLGDVGSVDGLDLTWHAMLEDVANVNHYMVDWISLSDALGEASSTCGYMAEAATEGLRGFLTPHSHATTRVHLSSDLGLLVSPAYVEWQWLCATPQSRT